MMRNVRRTSIAIAATIACGGAAYGCAADPEQAAQRFAERAERHVASGRYEAAAIEYRNVLKHQPRSAIAHQRLADVLRLLGDGDGAYSAYREACHLSPGTAGACLEAARLLLAAGRSVEADRQARAVVERAPDNVDAKVVLASAALQLGRIEPARRLLESAIALSPQPEAFARLAEVCEAENDRGGAERALRAGVERSNGSADARVYLARFLSETGRLDEAETELVEATQTDPRHELANRALASLYVNAGRAAAAEPYLIEAAKGGDPRHRSVLALADFYAAAGRWHDARNVLERAPREGALAIAARVRRAAIDYELGSTDSAHQALATLLKQKPVAEAWMLQAHFLARERAFDAAIASARRALGLEPNLADAHRIIAAAERERGNLQASDEALQAARRATHER